MSARSSIKAFMNRSPVLKRGQGHCSADARALVPHHRLVHPGAVDVAAQQASSAVVLGDEAVAVESSPLARTKSKTAHSARQADYARDPDQYDAE